MLFSRIKTADKTKMCKLIEGQKFERTVSRCAYVRQSNGQTYVVENQENKEYM